MCIDDVIQVDTREKNRDIAEEIKNLGYRVNVTKICSGDYRNDMYAPVIVERKQNLQELANNLMNKMNYQRLINEINRTPTQQKIVFLITQNDYISGNQLIHINNFGDIVNWYGYRPAIHNGKNIINKMTELMQNYQPGKIQIKFCEQKNTIIAREIVSILSTDTSTEAITA